MAKLTVNGRSFDIELVVFDKDGTLIDFEHLWGQKTRNGVNSLMQCAQGDASLRKTLYDSLGYHLETGRTAEDGPLATASMSKLYTIASAVLYQHGFAWEVAEKYVQEAFIPYMLAIPTADLIRPLGDVDGLFRRLKMAGVNIAVATSDDREATLATLRVLGVEAQVSLLVCGDDDIPNKPDPQAMWHIAAQFNVETERIMMVGDTVSDMILGTNAGVGCSLGVLSGAGNSTALASHADVVVDSIVNIMIE